MPDFHPRARSGASWRHVCRGSPVTPRCHLGGGERLLDKPSWGREGERYPVLSLPFPSAVTQVQGPGFPALRDSSRAAPAPPFWGGRRDVQWVVPGCLRYGATLRIRCLTNGFCQRAVTAWWLCPAMGSRQDINLQVERGACFISECRQRGKGPFPWAWFSSLLSEESLE